ncbi:hypothetical protein BO71DRAFT_118091 [Aspergillus ellipticus CBS 707.79]|uniref:Uncharacterized protein n=1 Tax=Aspergillus ellipticus CBS 707.79 TaxID=1448320 RepID=A0A319CVJ2_9EURO|nr:hypothetical protein BO71DRAFT_118091 [Aspergillus ellipticus CBS 707.79]
MNWTGGRLRRHSDLTGKTKKQCFRKPRPAASRASRASHFNETLFLRGNNSGVGRVDSVPSHNSTRQTKDCPSQLPVEAPQIPSIPNEPPRVTQDLDGIKRGLLERPDWAAVAVSRPLKITFPSAEEVRKFGRRRKITEDDRERLGTSSLRRKAPTIHKKPRDAASEMEAIRGLDIRINGRRIGADHMSTKQTQPTNVSSQSMLLDLEESGFPNGETLIRELGHGNPGRGDTYSERSWILDYSSISHGCLTSSVRAISQTEGEIHNPQHQSRVGLSQSGSSSISREVAPVRRRFTIDDQIIAEREGKLAAAYDPFRADRYPRDQPSQSPLRSRGSSLVDTASQHKFVQGSSDTASAFNYPSYGWLPRPRHNIQRFITRGVDGTIASLSQGTGLREHSGLAQLSTTVEQYTSPVKLFGQSVVFDGSRITRDESDRVYKHLEASDFTYSPTSMHEAAAHVPAHDTLRNACKSGVESFPLASTEFKFDNPKIVTGSSRRMGKSCTISAPAAEPNECLPINLRRDPITPRMRPFMVVQPRSTRHRQRLAHISSPGPLVPPNRWM